MSVQSTALVVANSQAMQANGANSEGNKKGKEFSVFQKQIIEAIAWATSSTLPPALCGVIADYCGPESPEENVSRLYDQRFINEVGLERLARLPVVTAHALRVDDKFPWVLDESFPKVNVDNMTDIAVRGESSEKETIFGRSKTVFIAIRYADNKWPMDKKVELVWQSGDGSGWGQTLFGFSTRVTTGDYARLRDLLDGKEIQGAPEEDRTHYLPDVRYFKA